MSNTSPLPSSEAEKVNQEYTESVKSAFKVARTAATLLGAGAVVASHPLGQNAADKAFDLTLAAFATLPTAPQFIAGRLVPLPLVPTSQHKEAQDHVPLAPYPSSNYVSANVVAVTAGTSVFTVLPDPGIA